MKTYNLCLLGFGNVGRALLILLQEKTAELRERYQIEWRLTGVATRRLGWLANPDGLDVSALLAGQFELLTTVASGDDVRDWLSAARADVLFELTSLNVDTGQPAIEHIRAALEHGAHAITANKGTVVHGYRELQALARRQRRSFLFEATVMGGAPIFSLFASSLPASNIIRFRGVVNSTSNVILEEIERGKSLEQAIQTAQELGIAETDPSADVDGWDAAVKVSAIATVLMDTPTPLANIEVEGIRHLDAEQIRAARAAGTPYKLVAQIEKIGEGIRAFVKPQRLSPPDPLAAVTAGSMLAHFELDTLPGLTITLDVPDYGPAGPLGPAVTAYDVLADFIRAVQSEQRG
ncbi:homoserine dehydrogenase [Dictyobacter aurantiacus]|uniref:Homoserine dehydrogenase n=1 Tax=Dictyobacter aurantiacus TaxID=1936993 RepID=A0A401ZHB4_9CHLR|nr:homoserine dehydrogenase [Dictyobacter aurantiacus]GCE06275.1 homoserine dehydrogenase [Dictyobacter aurantiacus]